MKYLIVTFALLSVALGLPAASKPEPYIISGVDATPSEAPFVVGITRSYGEKSEFCGGILISQLYVLTAASCIFNVPSATVLLGATNIVGPEQIGVAVEFKTHELYNPSSEDNDIGLIRLSRPVTLTEHIQIARLPTKLQRKTSFKGLMGYTAGWGKTGDSSEIVPIDRLKIVTNEVVSNLHCWEFYPANIRDTNVCTSTANNHTPCRGDEGGPLYIKEIDQKFTVIGIVNYQFSLGCKMGWPAVYNRVSYYLDWIEANSDAVIRPE